MIKLIKRKIDKWKKEYKDIMDEAKKETDGKTTKQWWKGQSKSEKLEMLSGGLMSLVWIVVIGFIIYLTVRVIIKLVN